MFHKGAQLYTVGQDLLAAGATPVLVEGPMDALAVTIAGQGRFVGVAPLGTSLTEEQAAQLAHAAHEHRVLLVVATDADLPGQVAAQRDYWLLAQHNLNPQTITLRPGSDPADLLAARGPDALRDVLENQTPLAETLLTERLAHLDGLPAARDAVTVLAASHPAGWGDGITRIAERTGIPAAAVRRDLAAAVRRWDVDPRAVATEQVGDVSTVRDRVTSRAPSSVSPLI